MFPRFTRRIAPFQLTRLLFRQAHKQTVKKPTDNISALLHKKQLQEKVKQYKMSENIEKRKLSAGLPEKPDFKKTKTASNADFLEAVLKKDAQKGAAPVSTTNILQAVLSDADAQKEKDNKPIVWIDCEMTGLDVFNDHIIEIACIITDSQLNVLDEVCYESVIHCPKQTMDKMGEWCIEHHGQSGLTEKVINTTKTLTQVEDELLAYISKYVAKGRGLLAGNSVHMDRVFMIREFPKIIEYLHYRIIDVSSIMEVGWRHNPRLMMCFPKKHQAHTAKADILESIDQLRWYWNNYLKSYDESTAVIQKYKEDKKKAKLTQEVKAVSEKLDETEERKDEGERVEEK
ncbi:hypothetical protein BABINDRAFT_160288 [Babjeviella inositovora NRRL Y-12698]|uniref:Exonuclease domain-containing protein n=1 Tax=Babjeviella inositovora NRRL Y-12698 TaxID=984486 RepID=A0A1E3QWN4_9ASCO|nr:uncharacterized protein BABINDRAFT_160288 [Babjeviella inositovora NRRL Y-12698]ODQ82093.1 hypothetical protein BABINDRAFT_160288 [Babjeviella inositovora NRRL Y-12698]